jgi:DNA ligase-1
MSNFVQVIKAAESAGGAGTKKAIVAALQQADKNTWRLIWEAQNPFRVFGVRKFDMPGDDAKVPASQKDYDRFFQLLDKLDAKELTGNDAREAVSDSLSYFDHETQRYLARILDKDLKAGFSADTVNKVLKDKYGVIPSFEVMLAEKMGEDMEFGDYITFPCQADFKYDGERTIIMVKKDEILPFSRSGKQSSHILGLFDEELYKIRNHLGFDYVLDCERISDLGFEATVNAKKAGNTEAKASLRLRAFFLMPLTDWMAQKCGITMEQNRAYLAELLPALGLKKIILTEGRIVQDEADMLEYCDEAIDMPENKARKIEGLILKNLNSTYEWDRTFTWIKVKRFYPADARIIGFYYGRPKSRLANTVGGIVVAGWTDDGIYFETCVGSGLNDDMRADMLANPKKYLGATAVIKFQEVSKTKAKKHASLRFPTLNRKDASGGIRFDKVVEMADDAVLEFKGRNMIAV